MQVVDQATSPVAESTCQVTLVGLWGLPRLSAGRYTIAISWFLWPCRRVGDLELEGVARVSGCYPVGIRHRCWSDMNPGSYSIHFNGGLGGQQHQEQPSPLCFQVFSLMPLYIYQSPTWYLCGTSGVPALYRALSLGHSF